MKNQITILLALLITFLQGSAQPETESLYAGVEVFVEGKWVPQASGTPPVNLLSQEFDETILKNFNYPRQAARMGIEGNTIATLEIDERGNFSKLNVRDIGSGTKLEITKVLAMVSDRWQPAMVNGNWVKSRITILFKFAFQPLARYRHPGIYYQSYVVEITGNGFNRYKGRDLGESGIIAKEPVADRLITGKILDFDKGTPIENVLVEIPGRRESVFTNSNGYFQIQIDSNDMELMLSGINYENGIIGIPESDRFNIQLKPEVTKLIDLELVHLLSDSAKVPGPQKPRSFSSPIKNAVYREGWSAFYNTIRRYVTSQIDFDREGSDLAVKFTIDGGGSVSNLLIQPDTTANAVFVKESFDRLGEWQPALQNNVLKAQSFELNILTKSELFKIVEVPAQFDGGLSAFYNYLKSEIRYPLDAQRLGIEGRVFVDFIVEKDGSLTNIKIHKSLHPSLDAEALRVLSKSPKWLPGTQNGKPVRQRMIQNVLFKFSNSSARRPSYSTGNREDKIVKVVRKETLAIFPGGGNKLIKFVEESKRDFDVDIPPNKFGNRVTVSFKVDTLGRVGDVKLKRSLGEPFDSEAIRIYSGMPDWTPATLDGIPIEKTITGWVSFNKIPTGDLLRAGDFFEKGVMHYDRGNKEKALEFFSKALEKNPTDFSIYFNRSITYLDLEMMETACSDLIKIKDLDPQARKLFEDNCSASTN